MNLDHIKTDCPSAYAQCLVRLTSKSANLNDFFDERHIYPTLTCEPSEEKPWGWEIKVHDTVERRFLREQCLYTSRDAAQSAVWTQCFAELERLANQGNA